MPRFDDEVFYATIRELHERLRRREFSAKELIEAFCDRLERYGPIYRALALSLRRPALERAGSLDDELRRDRIRGPLHGVPCGVKDLISVAGFPTTWGARPYLNQVFPYDATVVSRLRGAGAVIIGKLTMIELAGAGGYGYPSASVHGAGLNPWDLNRWAGGSSTGSASAVAAGLVTFAIGSETSGSILTPSAYCGVTGLRPTHGYVSRYGCMPLAWTMDKIGPICRSADDCGLVLQAISGGDPNDPGSAGRRFYYNPQFVRPFKDLTLGYAPVDFDEWAAERCRAAFRQALEVLLSLGFKVREVELPDLPYGETASIIIHAEGSAAFEELIRTGRVDQLDDAEQIAGLKAGLEIPAADYLRAMRVRRLIQQQLKQLFYEVDVLVSPTRFDIAPLVTEPLRSAPRSTRPKSHGLRDLIPAGNLAGLPALSLPCGFADGLPVAICLVGRPFSENTLLAIGRAFQSRTDWHTHRPPAPPVEQS